MSDWTTNPWADNPWTTTPFTTTPWGADDPVVGEEITDGTGDAITDKTDGTGEAVTE